jgi:hypothetical protein
MITGARLLAAVMLWACDDACIIMDSGLIVLREVPTDF